MTALAIAALVTWLAAVVVDVYLLGPWFGDQRGIFSRARLAGQLALLLLGLLCWIRFMLTGSVLVAWIAVALLAPAITVGISTVGRWVPHRAASQGPGPARPSGPAVFGITSDEMLARALEDETLTTQLVDDLLASVLAQPAAAAKAGAGRPGIAVAAAHGGLALVTFAFAVLAAVTAG
jgi:hypothetical protein